MTDTEELIRELPTALLRWYPFHQGAHCLYVGGAMQDAMACMLSEQGMHVTVKSIDEATISTGRFNYIICIETLEQHPSPVDALNKMMRSLSPTGVLLLGMNNRFGLRYFCGDRDPYTNWNFDGIENYRRLLAEKRDSMSGRLYTKAEIASFLTKAGITTWKFSSVFHGLEDPVFLFADEYVPQEDLSGRLFPSYRYPPTIFLEEESLYQSLIDNGMFHTMANSYLIECTLGGSLSDMLQVTSSIERGRENAMITVLHSNGTVTKQPAYTEGFERLQHLAQNMAALEAHGISVVKGTMENNVYIMPRIECETGQLYLKKLLLKDKGLFLQEMDRFRDLIISSSDITDSISSNDSTDLSTTSLSTECKTMAKGLDPLLRLACLDLVPLNSFYIDGEFVFFDQEFSQDDCPVNRVLYRMVASFYSGNPELASILPEDTLYARYGLLEEKDKLVREDQAFLRELRNETALADYHVKTRRSDSMVRANRLRMNYSASDYQKIFIDVFEDIDGKNIILFGAGRFAQKFLDVYKNDYTILAIVDNAPDSWGKELNGIKVSAPCLLQEMTAGTFKVIVCVRNYISILQQLDRMGIQSYSVFNPNHLYRRQRHPTFSEDIGTQHKKYHLGYVAGVFDLFHIGHLNLLRRAKEQCEYLLVGVVSDRGVIENKKVEPFIPFEERIEIVRSCHYVDEAVEIPFIHCTTEDAWKMHRFDVQFSGSDYEHDAGWLEAKRFLEAHGATMVFFPYTQSTSSTRLKKMIEKSLL